MINIVYSILQLSFNFKKTLHRHYKISHQRLIGILQDIDAQVLLTGVAQIDQVIMDNIPIEGSSWGETIKALEKSKKELHWNVDDASIRVKRINLRERRIQERELDPILMRYRDSAAEKNYNDKKASKMQAILERSTNSVATKLNIITNEGPPRSVVYDNTTKQDPPNRINLLSNLMNKDHIKAPILYDQTYVDRKFQPRSVVELNKRVPRRREFNIVSNNFYQNDAEKVAAEQEAIREEVTRKYWETHGYNAVVGQFYSDVDEERYAAQREANKLVQGKSQESRIPPSVLYSEGKSYNIVNHEVVDDEKLKTTMLANTRALNKVKKVREKQKQLAEAASAADTLNKERKMNRIRFNKWEQQVDRGYNAVFNTLIDLTNPVDAQKVMPYPRRPQTVWDQVQQKINKEVSRAASSGPKDLSGGDGGSGSDVVRSSDSGGGLASDATLAVSIPGSITSQWRSTSSRIVVSGGASARAVTAAGGSGNDTQRSTARAMIARDHSVPRLDMTQVEPPMPVAYSDRGGPPGAPIAMIRTGGFN